jgi:hypothetical protein
MSNLTNRLLTNIYALSVILQTACIETAADAHEHVVRTTADTDSVSLLPSLPRQEGPLPLNPPPLTAKEASRVLFASPSSPIGHRSGSPPPQSSVQAGFSSTLVRTAPSLTHPAPQNLASLPPVFNKCAMTRAVPNFEHDRSFRGPSDRIGSNFSPMSMDLTQRRVEELSRKSLPMSPTSACALTKSVVLINFSPCKPQLAATAQPVARPHAEPRRRFERRRRGNPPLLPHKVPPPPPTP